jgi:hypothetical protein
MQKKEGKFSLSLKRGLAVWRKEKLHLIILNGLTVFFMVASAFEANHRKTNIW